MPQNEKDKENDQANNNSNDKHSNNPWDNLSDINGRKKSKGNVPDRAPPSNGAKKAFKEELNKNKPLNQGQGSGGNFIDDLIDKVSDFLNGDNSGNSRKSSKPKFGNGKSGGSSFMMRHNNMNTVFIIFLVLIGFWLSSGFYRVQEVEQALVLRFGKLNRIAQPGLRYHLPSPFETKIIRNVAAVNKIDGGVKSDVSKSEQDQGLVLTQDENMVYVNYTVLWKINDLTKFVFTMRDPEATIRVAAESVIREVMGQNTALFALNEGRGQISAKAQEILQGILNSYKSGVQIVSFQLQRVEPPAPVVQAFNDIQVSRVDADRMQKEAQAYYNDTVPRAQAQATKVTSAAEAEKSRVVLEAEGKKAELEAINKAYQQDPELTKKILYMQTMQEILKGNSKTIVSGSVASSKGGVVPYLNLQQPADNKKESTASNGKNK